MWEMTMVEMMSVMFLVRSIVFLVSFSVITRFWLFSLRVDIVMRWNMIWNMTRFVWFYMWTLRVTHSWLLWLSLLWIIQRIEIECRGDESAKREDSYGTLHF